MKQIIFSASNIGLIYLSPYCDYKITSFGVNFYSKLSQAQVKINTYKGKELIDILENGVSYDSLCVFLSRDLDETRPDDWIKNLFRLKILE